MNLLQFWQPRPLKVKAQIDNNGIGKLTQGDGLGSRIILAVMPHPDDLELTCAGSIARWIRDGDQAFLLVVRKGARGAKLRNGQVEKMAQIRVREQEEAAAVIGFRGVALLDFEDGGLEDDDTLRGALVKQIRTMRPDVAVAIDPLTVIHRDSYVNHRDHRKLGMALLDALYPEASNASYFPEQVEAGLTPHKVPELLLTNTDSPNYWVDVTETLEIRFEALRKHRSQMKLWPDNGEEIIRQQRAEAEYLAIGHGMTYAEVFRRVVASPLN
jgi:LmbE family N-acetylglucosaminyl deacetylase